jgi:hypothetical protein
MHGDINIAPLHCIVLRKAPMHMSVTWRGTLATAAHISADVSQLEEPQLFLESITFEFHSFFGLVQFL